MPTISHRLRSLTAGLPRTYWLLWVGTLINRLGGFVIPFLTLYLTQERGLPVSQATLMVSLFGAGSFTAALVGGELTDRLGRRPVMLLSFLLAPVTMIALGLVRPLAILAPLVYLQGFLTDLSRPAVSAMVADRFPRQSVHAPSATCTGQSTSASPPPPSLPGSWHAMTICCSS